MKYVYVLAMVVILVGTAAADSVTNTCSQTCGGKEIPYPFGINDTSSDSDCFVGGRSISLTCYGSKIYAGNLELELLNIDVSAAQIDVLLPPSRYCGVGDNNQIKLDSGLDAISFSSKENKFINVGYNSSGYFKSYHGNNEYLTGCSIGSFADQSLINGTCSGIGCCQIDIPPLMWNISIEATNFNNESKFCSYAFVVKNGSYTFSSTHLLQEGFPFEELPVVLDWTIGEENCSTASNGVNYGCKKNSYCDDKDTYFGYRCHCNPGFEGNPYHPNGCTDINECAPTKHECHAIAICKNTYGNYTCECPKGYSGDGTKEGGCQLHDGNANPIIVLPTVLDPEYMQTSQLTEKSDVYSFGVVLVELLTGEKPFSFGRPEERRSLAMHFLSCLEKDNVFEVIQDGLWNEENKQVIKEVAVLAAKCLRLRGEERPSMKEVAMELEGMRLMDKHSWINDDLNVDESRYLLHESSSSLYEPGDSSKHGDIRYDSLKELELVVLDDGR